MKNHLQQANYDNLMWSYNLQSATIVNIAPYQNLKEKIYSAYNKNRKKS